MEAKSLYLLIQKNLSVTAFARQQPLLALRRRRRKKTTHNWIQIGYAFTEAHSSLWLFVSAETRRKPTVLPLFSELGV